MSLQQPASTAPVKITDQDALEYHRLAGRPGKITVMPSKPLNTQRDLGLAYTPGVAAPVLAIEKKPDEAYEFTSKSNLVAVISNGTAILGLGDRGALAAKPVMEGKGVLFKKFADIDVFDIEINEKDPEKLIQIIASLAPTFGGINLEDIKAPECFEVESRLKQMLDIPVFHDDQHGTAIITAAGLINGLELVGKKPGNCRLVISGAGAAATSCAELAIRVGIPRENVIMVDRAGVIYRGRTQGMNKYKERYAAETKARTLADALRGADIFYGLSAAGLLTPEMCRLMGPRPLIFAMANPDPEISYDDAKAARPDAIVATGRSDFPNQINNVLGFPFIFRGALDVRAKAINEEMKIAAARALAALAKEDVPDSVLRAYNLERLQFGPDYIIPKPFDPRVLLWEAPAVAAAAMETGVARKQINLEAYRHQLTLRQGRGQHVRQLIINKAKNAKVGGAAKRVVYGEGEDSRILRAAAQVAEEKIAQPILIGRPEVISTMIRDLGLDYQPQVVNPLDYPQYDAYAEAYYNLRARKGISPRRALKRLREPNVIGPMMIKQGDADAYISGLTYDFREVIRPALQIHHTRPGSAIIAGVNIMIADDRVFIFSDAAINIEPTAEQLADIALLAADYAKQLELEPRVAMLSFSNFGSTRHPLTQKVEKAVELVLARRPNLPIDGELQADIALSPELIQRRYSFCRVREPNVLIFPSLEAANVAYKLLAKLGNAQSIGPILLGAGAPIQVLQPSDDVNHVVYLTAVAVMDALSR